MKIYFKTPAELDKELEKGGTKWTDHPADKKKLKVGSQFLAAVKVNGCHEIMLFDLAHLGNPVTATVAEKPEKVPNLVEGQAVDVPLEAILKIADD